MAIVKPKDMNLRGKVGEMVFAQQPDGTVTVRAKGERRAPPTPAEKAARDRFKAARQYVLWAMAQPELEPAYTEEAVARGVRPEHVAMSDFLTDPILSGVDLSGYRCHQGDPIFIVTGDDFKVVQVRVSLIGPFSRMLEEGWAEAAEGSVAKAWVYHAQTTLGPGQMVQVKVTASDRCGHTAELSRDVSI